MKEKLFGFASICVFCAFSILLAGCVSTERPFTQVYTGETEPLLLNTRWELQDLKSMDNLIFIVEFGAEGAVTWYNVPESYNSMLSENSTWERNGNDVIFNSGNGHYLYEGKLDSSGETPTIAGRYKSGYNAGYVMATKTYPEGDFTMTKQ